MAAACGCHDHLRTRCNGRSGFAIFRTGNLGRSVGGTQLVLLLSVHLETVAFHAPLALAILALSVEESLNLLLVHRLVVEEKIVRNDVAGVERVEPGIAILLGNQRLDLLDIAENEDADHRQNEDQADQKPGAHAWGKP